MTKTLWRYLRFDERNDDGTVTKNHIAPASLVAPLLADLRARGVNTKVNNTLITKTGVDQPGMVRVDRPWEDFHIYDLEFHVPSEDVAWLYGRIAKLEVRRFPKGQEYYKLHDWQRAVVLRPMHKISLEVQLQERIQAAEERATIFYADKKPAKEVLRDACAKARGVDPEEVPIIEQDSAPRDRFIPKHRGQA